MMAVEKVVFENLPNFRQAGGHGLTNKRGERVRDGLLYRSSRTDFVTSKDKSVFLQLGIKSIVDLRRQSEYERSDGDKLLDDLYSVSILKKDQVHRMKPSFRWGSSNTKAVLEEGSIGYRYLVNMWTMKIIWHVFMQANFFVRWLSLVLVLFDWLTGLHLFVKFFAWLVINHQTVAQQYIDVVEMTRPVIIDVLRLMCHKEDSLPMLIHCAHGKDRTGIIVAIVLGLLEVDNKSIVNDYTQSEVTVLEYLMYCNTCLLRVSMVVCVSTYTHFLMIFYECFCRLDLPALRIAFIKRL